MKHVIKKEEYRKVLLENVEIDLPEETLYFWHNGIRRAYSVKPVWTTWNVEYHNKPEEIYEYQIVEVDPGSFIKRHAIRVSDIERLLMDRNYSLSRLLDNILYNNRKEDVRSEKDFMADFDSTIDHLKEALQNEKA